MAVLKLNPTKLPDFSGVSEILKNAGLALDRGFDSAQGLLGSYQSGQQEKVDNEVFSEIAGLDREGLQSYFDGNGLKGRTISKDMRDRLGSQFGVIADVNQTRQQITSGAASTVISQAAESRSAAEETFKLGRRDAATGSAQLQLAADRERRGLPTGAAGQILAAAPGDIASNGATPGAGTSVAFQKVIPGIFAGESQGDYDALFGFSNRPGGKFENVKVTQMSVNELLEFQKVGGEYSNYVKANTKEGVAASPAGGFQVVGATLKDAAKGLGLTGNEKMTPELQDKIGEWIFNKQGIGAWKGFVPGVVSAPTAVATGPVGPEADPLSGLRAIGDPAGLGEPGILGPRSPQERLAEAQAAGIQPISASVNTPAVRQSTPAQDALDRANANNPFITGPELIAQDAKFRAAGDEAIARSDKARAKKVASQTASEIIKQVGVLSNQTQEDVVADVFQASLDAGLSPQEAIASAERASIVAGGALSGLVAPSITGDKVLDSIIANEGEVANAALEALPIDRLTKNAKKYAAASTVTQGLITSLSIGRDGETTSSRFWGLIGEEGTDDKILTDHLNEIALEAKVTPEIAAAAMFEEFVRDPFWTNTVAKRFPKVKVLEYLKVHMSASAVAVYQSDVQRNLNREQELVAGRLRLDVLRISLKKAKAQGKTTRVKEIEGSIEALRGTLLTGATPREGELALADYISPQGINMSAQLAKLTPGSQAHKDLQGLIILKIQGDPFKTESEKILLISAIKS